MENAVTHRWRPIAVCAMAALGLSLPASAQTVSGQARAIQASLTGLFGITTTVLADTGVLSGSTDAREASAEIGSVASLLVGKTLHATTLGWPDEVRSEASVADLSINLAGLSLDADFVMATASAVQGTAGGGAVKISGLSINGTPVPVTGVPNQTIVFPGGRVVVNERPPSASSTIVNALHIAVTGIADVIVASATARVQ